MEWFMIVEENLPASLTQQGSTAVAWATRDLFQGRKDVYARK